MNNDVVRQASAPSHVRLSGMQERRGNGRLVAHAGVALPLVLILSLLLNLWGNHWGMPEAWQPDEITGRAAAMVIERRLDPEYPAYGALHYYVVAAGAVAPAGLYALLFDPEPDKQSQPAAYERWKDRQKVRAYVVSRSISGLMATAQVLIVYALGILLFNRFVGVVAALFLAVAPYFVVTAHFATVDTAANFWYWLSILFAVLNWKLGGTRWSILAALTAGFAIGTKLDHAVILGPLVLSHFLRGEGFPAGKIILSCFLVLTGYVIANPYLLISPFEFLDGTTRWLFMNMVRTGDTSYVKMLTDTTDGLAFPLFIAAIAGMGYALYQFIVGKHRGAFTLLFLSIVPFYIALSSTLTVPWYVPLLFPGLVLFAAYGFDGLRRMVAQKYRFAVTLGAVALAAVSATKSFIFDLQLVNDARYQAAAWIEAHVPEKSTIQLGPRPPAINSGSYDIRTRPPDPRRHAHIVTWRENLARHAPYQRLRRTILALERSVGPRLGLQVREQPYEIWPDRALPGDADIVDIGAERSDYIVLVEYLEKKRIEELERPDSGYQRVAQLQFRDPLGWNPTLPFVNPVVHVFQREDLQGVP